MHQPVTSLRSALRLGLIGHLAVCLLLVSHAAITENTAAEDAATTPLSDFAPDEIQASGAKRYDQGLTINKITIQGNQLIDDETIRQQMAIQPGSLYNKTSLQQDLKRIHSLGYFTEKIRAVPVATSSGVHLRIEVEENAPVTGINIKGNSLMSSEELESIFASQTGLPQNVSQLNEAIEKIEKRYAEKGYVLARVTTIADDPDGMINLTVNEGKIGNVYFVGNRKTKDYVVKRYMATKAGDIYNEKVLGEDLKRVFSSQTFSDVRRVITANPENPDVYDLTVELDEKKTGAISLGGGLDTVTGIFGSFGFADPNFGGRGESFGVTTGVGSGIVGRGDTLANARTYQMDISWSTPSVRHSDNALGVNLYGRDMASMNVPLGIERRIGLSTTWSRPLNQLPNTSFSLTMGGERVALREAGTNSALRTLGLTNRQGMLTSGTFVNLSPTIAYDTRDNRFEPTRGWLSSVSLNGAMGVSGGSYGTATANIRKYFHIRDGITLALNAQAGSSLLGDIPDFNMFRMGGSYSVRGFREGGLGIGNGFMTATTELRTRLPLVGKLKTVPFLNTMSTAFFLDAGQLLDQRELLTASAFEHTGMGISAGAGLRFTIPGVGPIRVDYAIPLAGGNNNYYRRLNIGVGQKF